MSLQKQKLRYDLASKQEKLTLTLMAAAKNEVGVLTRAYLTNHNWNMQGYNGETVLHVAAR